MNGIAFAASHESSLSICCPRPTVSLKEMHFEKPLLWWYQIDAPVPELRYIQCEVLKYVIPEAVTRAIGFVVLGGII